MLLRLCLYHSIFLGFQLSPWQLSLTEQDSDRLTPSGVLLAVRTRVWTERFGGSNSPVKQDGLLLEPEGDFNMLWWSMHAM
jgi:hypothetical protein